MRNDSISSYVPEESRKEIADYLRRAAAEWNKSDDSVTHGDGEIFSALTRTKKSYPAIWMGLNDEKLILSCRGKTDGQWNFSLKKPIYKDDERVLVGLEGENGGYEGDLIFQVLPSGVDAESALRVVNAQQAVGERSESAERGVERLSEGKAKGLFKRFMDEHPQLRHDLKKRGFGSSAFVSYERRCPTISVFSREHGIPAAYVGGETSSSGCSEGVVVCTEDYDLRKSIETRKSHVSLRQALVELGRNDLVFHVAGRSPLERTKFALSVEGVRVKNPWRADKAQELPRSVARRLFFRLLKKHPEVSRAIQQEGGAEPEALAGDVPSGEPKRYRGTVKFFRERKNYGFISPDEDAEDVFVHRSRIEEADSLIGGDRVEFVYAWAEKSLEAKRVKKIRVSREIGKVKWFDEGKGYGFVKNAEGEDVFVHRSDIKSGMPDEGDRVEFEIKTTEKGLRAANVAPA